MKTTSKVLLSLLAGAAAGSVLGLLIAPETGEETRKKLAKSAKKLNNNLKVAITDLSEKGQAALKDLSETIEELKKASEQKS